MKKELFMKNKILVLFILFLGSQGFSSTFSEAENCKKIVGNSTTSKISEDKKNLKLQTERLELRVASEPSDINSLVQIFMHPKVQEMSGSYISETRVKRIISLGHKTLEEAKNSGAPLINFAIIFEGKVVGMTQIGVNSETLVLGIAKRGQYWASMSYHLHPDAWGKGIASESSRRMVQFAFDTLGFDGVHGDAIKSNTSSIQVLEKTGFEWFESLDPTHDHFQIKRSSYQLLAK